MRRKICLLLLCIVSIVSFAACGGKVETAVSEEDKSIEVEEFNPDKAKDSMTIEQLRELNGVEVPVEKNLKLAAVMKAMTNEFWRTFEEGYKEAAKQSAIRMYTITTKNEDDEDGQANKAMKLASTDIDAMMLSPITDKNLTDAVELAKTNNIITVNVNDGLIETADHFVGANSYKNGTLAAKWISDQLSGEGQIAIVKGLEGAYSTRERTDGFTEWFEENNPEVEIVAQENADWDRSKAKEIAVDWIKRYPNLKAIFCNNDDMALGVQEAVDESNKDIYVVGVDGIGEAYESIRQGKLDATVDSFPFYVAQVATECTLRSIAGQELPSVVTTPQALIDQTNVDKEAADIIGWEKPLYILE